MSWDPSDAHAHTWLPPYGQPPALHDSPPPAPDPRWAPPVESRLRRAATACSLGRLLGPVGPGSLVAFVALAANPAESFDADAVTTQGDRLGGALLIRALVAVVLAQIRDREL